MSFRQSLGYFDHALARANSFRPSALDSKAPEHLGRREAQGGELAQARAQFSGHARNNGMTTEAGCFSRGPGWRDCCHLEASGDTGTPFGTGEIRAGGSWA